MNKRTNHAIQKEGDSINLSIYIHVPFCESKCNYCDFNSFANMESYFGSYVSALVREIAETPELQDANIISVFIGGGTPSILPSFYIEKIMNALGQYKIAKGAEITIEANPNSLTKDKLRDYRSLGINRLSVGLQAYQDRLLKIMGRPHTSRDFLTCVNNATSVGFNNISADLIFALPGQSFADWEESLQAVTQANLRHISCYGLIIEEGTPFYDAYESIDDELDRRMYYKAVEFLGSRGFSRYEISNFAQKGFESRHNLVYWERGNYIGLGLSAHSLYDNVRFENTSDLARYIEGREGRQNITKLSQEDAMAEFMFLGLRKSAGVSIAEFHKEFGVDMFDVYGDVLRRNVENSLLEAGSGTVKLSGIGIDLSNLVLSEFLM